MDSSEVIPGPTQQDDSDSEQMGVGREGPENNEVSNGLENTSDVTGNGGENSAIMVWI